MAFLTILRPKGEENIQEVSKALVPHIFRSMEYSRLEYEATQLFKIV